MDLKKASLNEIYNSRYDNHSPLTFATAILRNTITTKIYCLLSYKRFSNHSPTLLTKFSSQNGW